MEATDATRASALVEAVRLVTKGAVYPLDHVIDMAIPQLSMLPPWAHFMLTHPGSGPEQVGARRPGPISDRLAINAHTGTHIDALGHWSTDGRSFGDVAAASNWTPRGLKRLGVDECGPIFCRGVLFDVPKARGVGRLEAGDAISPEDLLACCRQSGMEIGRGNAALVRSGWAQLWPQKDNYLAGQPGLSPAAAEWLADHGVVLIGGDTVTLEVLPGPKGEPPYPVHNICLVERGIYLLENMNLEIIAAQEIYEFLFVVLPTRIRGATGCPVLPVAVR
jgi:kynurenine formamidase